MSSVNAHGWCPAAPMPSLWSAWPSPSVPMSGISASRQLTVLGVLSTLQPDSFKRRPIVAASSETESRRPRRGS